MAENTIKYNELATKSEILLTDLMALSDSNGILYKKDLQSFVNFFSTTSGLDFKGKLLIADTPVDGWYFAGESGTYTNAGSLVVSVSDNICIIIVESSATVFSKVDIPISITIDTTVIEDSPNPVSGGTMFDALADKVDTSLVNTTDTPDNTSTELFPAGKILDVVDDKTKAIKDLIDISKISLDNVQPNISETGFYLKSDNTTVVYSGGLISKEIESKEGEVFYYTGRYGNEGVAALYFNSSDTVISAVTQGTIGDVELLKLTSPANTSYVKFASLDDSFKLFRKSLLLEKIEDSETLIDENTSEIEDNDKEISEISNIITNQNEKYNLTDVTALDFFRTPTVDYIGTVANTYLTGKGITNQLEFVASDDRDRIAFLKKTYDKSINGKYFQTQFFVEVSDIALLNSYTSVFFADEDGLNWALKPVTPTITEIETGLYKVVYKSTALDTATDFRQVWIGANYEASSAVSFNLSGFYSYVSENDFETINFENEKPLLKEFLAIQKKVAQLEVPSTDALYIDKTVWWLGDSIVNYNNIVELLNEKITFKNQYNLAVPGCKWAHTASTVYDTTSTGSDNNVIWNQVNKMIDMVTNSGAEIPEVILIPNGTNDINNALGTPSDVFDEAEFINLAQNDVQLRNVSGAIRYNIDTIISNYPNVQIILFTPIQRGTSSANVAGTYTDNQIMFQICDIMKECGAYASAKVVDQTRNIGIYGYQEMLSNKYLYDYLHPSLLGRQLMTDFWFSEIKKNVLI